MKVRHQICSSELSHHRWRWLFFFFLFSEWKLTSRHAFIHQVVSTIAIVHIRYTPVQEEKDGDDEELLQNGYDWQFKKSFLIQVLFLVKVQWFFFFWFLKQTELTMCSFYIMNRDELRQCANLIPCMLLHNEAQSDMKRKQGFKPETLSSGKSICTISTSVKSQARTHIPEQGRSTQQSHWEQWTKILKCLFKLSWCGII